jgi:ribulose-phosphate 3-epimerase
MSRSETLRSLGKSSAVIAPSLLKCNYAQLERELGDLEQAGMEVLHLDVMDGHFVPNLSYGPMVIESLRKVCSVPFDAHLMISDPARYLDDYISAGCDGITFHIEAVPEPGELLQRIRDAGLVSGLALNPGTAVQRNRIRPVDLCDYVLVMSVEPGFGGQKFMPIALEKTPPGSGTGFRRGHWWEWTAESARRRSERPRKPVRTCSSWGALCLI